MATHLARLVHEIASTNGHVCCGARCRHCDEWRSVEDIRKGVASKLTDVPDRERVMRHESADAENRWCDSCDATVYTTLAGVCSSCGGVA